MPGSTNTLQLRPYTNPDGYKIRDSITFGVPLHYAVPQQLFDCSSSAYQFDLQPGKVVIPIMIHIQNLTPQQSPAFYPTLHITDKDGNYGVQITGASGSANMWADGSCAQSVSHNLNAGGTDAVWGFIGPATPAQLAATYINVTWEADASAPTVTLPLTQLLPHQAASWLVANGGGN